MLICFIDELHKSVVQHTPFETQNMVNKPAKLVGPKVATTAAFNCACICWVGVWATAAFANVGIHPLSPEVNVGAKPEAALVIVIV